MSFFVGAPSVFVYLESNPSPTGDKTMTDYAKPIRRNDPKTYTPHYLEGFEVGEVESGTPLVAGVYLMGTGGMTRYVKAAGQKFVTLAWSRGGAGDRLHRSSVDRDIDAGKYTVLTAAQYSSWTHGARWERGKVVDAATYQALAAEFLGSL